MSGGTYNHLYDSFDLMPIELEGMANRLQKLWPGSKAARDTKSLVKAIAMISAKSTLLDVWRDVEWMDSGDCDLASASESVQLYERLAR